MVVLAAMHEAGIVRRAFSRVIALDGRIVADGRPDEVFARLGVDRRVETFA